MAASETDPTAGLSDASGRVSAPSGFTSISAALPALTILFHPDVRRIGERAFLSEIFHRREAPVSRHLPEFEACGGTAGQSLADPYLSRKPFLLQPAAGGGVTLQIGESRTRVAVQGEPVGRERAISAAEIANGTVLELSDRIVLLLHLAVPPPPGLPPERFGLVGDSPALGQIRGDIRRVADLEVPVLLRGETGTGKELVARAVHDAGPRRHAPFISVNLGAIPPSLAASELFGAEKGAFTGAVRQQAGYFRTAHGGTLFLDEIGEAPPEVQVMLLRVLETGEIHPVGLQSSYRVDVRIIAATDSNLERRAREGAFREPLLHRLTGYEIWMPPLRERRDDIGRLLIHFLRQELERTGEAQRLGPAAASAPLWLPPSLVARLARHDWPGNVRQLRNVIRQLVIGSRGLSRLELGPHLERALREDAGRPATRPPLSSSGDAPLTPLPPALVEDRPRRRPSEVREGELLAALRACRWDLQATAERLGISRPSLYALIETAPNVRKAGDLRPEEIVRGYEECGGDVEALVDRLEVSRKALSRRLRELGLKPKT